MSEKLECKSCCSEMVEIFSYIFDGEGEIRYCKFCGTTAYKEKTGHENVDWVFPETIINNY